MYSHDNLVPVYINMSLHKRNRFSQDIIASTNQVYVEDRVLSDEAEDPLVEVGRGGGGEGDDDPGAGVGRDLALDLGEAEEVLLVGQELEGGRQVAVVHYVQESVRLGAQLHLSKVD